MTSEEIVIDVRPNPSSRHLIVTDSQLRIIAQAVQAYCANSRPDLKHFADQLIDAIGPTEPKPEPTGVRTVRIFARGAEQPADLTAVLDSDGDRWDLKDDGLWHFENAGAPPVGPLEWERLLDLYAPLRQI